MAESKASNCCAINRVADRYRRERTTLLCCTLKPHFRLTKRCSQPRKRSRNAKGEMERAASCVDSALPSLTACAASVHVAPFSMGSIHLSRGWSYVSLGDYITIL